MRTNIDIDEGVLRQAQRITGARTKRETVDIALRDLVARHQRAAILGLRGKVRWEGDLEASRAGRLQPFSVTRYSRYLPRSRRVCDSRAGITLSVRPTTG
jgi:Arc/MetJ family transcription regulator